MGILSKNKNNILGLIILNILFPIIASNLGQNFIYFSILFFIYVIISIKLLLPIIDDFLNQKNSFDNPSVNTSSYKKPWEYKNYYDKLDSIYYGYGRNEQVLKQVLKKEKDQKVKVHASWILFTMNGLAHDGEQLFNYLRNDVGLDEVDASDLMFAGAEYDDEVKAEMRRYV